MALLYFETTVAFKFVLPLSPVDGRVPEMDTAVVVWRQKTSTREVGVDHFAQSLQKGILTFSGVPLYFFQVWGRTFTSPELSGTQHK